MPNVPHFRTVACFNSRRLLQQPPIASTAAACFNSRRLLQQPPLASTATDCFNSHRALQQPLLASALPLASIAAACFNSRRARQQPQLAPAPAARCRKAGADGSSGRGRCWPTTAATAPCLWQGGCCSLQHAVLRCGSLRLSAVRGDTPIAPHSKRLHLIIEL